MTGIKYKLKNFFISMLVKVRIHSCHMFGHRWVYGPNFTPVGIPTWRWCQHCGEFETGEFEKE